MRLSEAMPVRIAEAASSDGSLDHFRATNLNRRCPTGMKFLRFSILCAAFVLASMHGASARAGEADPDLLEKKSKSLARDGAVDCGRVEIRASPKKATECALAAQKAGKPFHVRYDLQGIDSDVAVAIVRTPTGSVIALQYDSDPSGGGRREGGVVFPKECPVPVHLWANPSGRINCFQSQSAPPRDAVSPNREPY